MCFFENFQYWQFWSTNFSMKTASTEKTEHTTTTATENPRNLSSQIFYFWTFVTEIFQFKWRHFSFFLKIQKNANCDKLGRRIAGASWTPRSKLIGIKWSSVRVLQSWFYQFFSEDPLFSRNFEISLWSYLDRWKNWYFWWKFLKWLILFRSYLHENRIPDQSSGV